MAEQETAPKTWHEADDEKRDWENQVSDMRWISPRPCTCVCCGMFRKLLSRDPMPTNLLGVVAPGVEYAGVREQKKRHQCTCHCSPFFTDTLQSRSTSADTTLNYVDSTSPGTKMQIIEPRWWPVCFIFYSLSLLKTGSNIAAKIKPTSSN